MAGTAMPKGATHRLRPTESDARSCLTGNGESQAPFSIGATHRFRRKLALLAKRRRLMDDLDVFERVAPPPRVALGSLEGSAAPTRCPALAQSSRV